MTSTCSSCGASIVWGVTRNGKRMPLDAHPVTPADHTGPVSALFAVLQRPGADPLALSIGTGIVGGEELWLERALCGRLSHWSTCPSAEQHRKPTAATV